MSHDNYGPQSGNNSINIGVGDFRGANVHVGSPDRPIFTPEQMAIQRHLVLGGRLVRRESLGVFSVVTGLASLVGLYFTLFQAFPSPKYSSWSMLFLFLLGIAGTCLLIAVILKKQRFAHFLLRRFYLETGSDDGLFLTRLTAGCPWCGSRMNLRNLGPKDGPRTDKFICERNPAQHTIRLDPTLLPEIDEACS